MPIKQIVDKVFKSVGPSKPILEQIIKDIQAKNGVVYLVGGIVRDIVLDYELSKDYNFDMYKDLDIEIHKLTLEELTEILKKYGPVNYVGKSFGVLRLEKLNIDWSLPRADSAGRRPEVNIDPQMGIDLALKRRDLTINSIAININTYEIADPYNGLEDLKNKILRATDSNLFKEDPLRFFRVMQFVSRFEFKPEPELDTICKNMDLSGVSKERIELEFEKMLLKSRKPSLGLRWINKIDRLKDVFPELYATVGVEQEHEWHPEGDVFEHTMQALDAGAKINLDNTNDTLTLLYTCICHDLGKPKTTKIIDGRLRSWSHEIVGVDIAKSFLKRITDKKDLVDTVCKLVRWHMAPGMFVNQNATDKAYKKLAQNLWPQTNIKMLANLAIADLSGRNAKLYEPLDIHQPIIKEFLKRAQESNVDFQKEDPVALGRDFMDVIAPGPKLGDAVKLAYEIQIEHNIKDKNKLKELVLEQLKLKN